MNMLLAPTKRMGSPLGFCSGRFRTEFVDGQSRESEVVAQRYVEIADHFYQPLTRLRFDPFRRFYELASTWRRDVKDLSDIDLMCTHPAYQEIIGMGESVLPLIFKELRTAQDYWFWALKAITGEDPVPEKDRGRIRRMKRNWINWADERGYLRDF